MLDLSWVLMRLCLPQLHSSHLSCAGLPSVPCVWLKCPSLGPSLTILGWVHFCWLLPQTGWPGRKAVREGCRGGERETRGIKKQWRWGLRENTLWGVKWQSRILDLTQVSHSLITLQLPPRAFLSILSMNTVQWLSPAGQSVWHLWCCLEWAVTECIFNFDGLAHCWRRPLFTGIVSELPLLQQILNLGFLYERSQKGEVLLQKTSCTGITGHCSNTLYVGKWGWMDESLEDFSFMKITVSCLWSFPLHYSEYFIQDSRIHFQCG